MPRSLTDILRHADELAAHAEEFEPGADADTSTPEMLVRRAAWKRDQAERDLADAIALARSDDVTWSQIGRALSTSPQAAQRRYAQTVRARKVDTSNTSSGKVSRKAPASGRYVGRNAPASGKYVAANAPVRKASAARRRAS